MQEWGNILGSRKSLQDESIPIFSKGLVLYRYWRLVGLSDGMRYKLCSISDVEPRWNFMGQSDKIAWDFYPWH